MADDRALLEDTHRLRDQLAAPPSWQDPALCFDPGALPPLPEICDESLRRQVFLYWSAPALRTGDDGAPTTPTSGSYERLEGFGDRIINSQSYAVLHRTFAGAPPSSIGNISAKFTCNRTISYLSLAYGSPDRLSHSGGQNLVANQKKTAADLFEAYVGALSESATLPGAVKVEDWLAKLFDKSVWSGVTRLVDNAIARFDKVVDPKTGVVVLHGLRESPTGDPLQVTVLYGPFNQGLGWHAAMHLGPDKVSCGRGKSKQEAEADARDRLYKRVLGL
ncbi:hypothetical protein RHOSPDRAFT_34913 [Rhodotorula sp. JG-1b]|nr:hypothetical protein RHOSPDRAFT_34913 [Rhodotorula sp. JG-1b]